MLRWGASRSGSEGGMKGKEKRSPTLLRVSRIRADNQSVGTLGGHLQDTGYRLRCVSWQLIASFEKESNTYD